MSKKVCVSYSLGKDSTLALYRAIKSGCDVMALIISVNEENLRSWFHGVDSELINAVSSSLGIPVILAKSDGSNYREVFVEALEEAKSLGVSECVFGDIDIEDHFDWCSAVCDEAKMSAWFPLWKEDRREIVEEFINSGFKAIIKTVSKQFKMDMSFLNRQLTLDVLDELESLGVDVCGENGEYHTFVFDGPIFNKPIATEYIDTYESEYAYSAILKLK